WEKFAASLRNGEAGAIRLLDRICLDHGDAVARIAQLVDPEVVYLTGAFSEFEDRYLNRVTASVASALEGHYFSPPPIQFVTLGEYAGALGASALAASHYLPDPG